ncbi:DUF5695 domain-containing protein [Bifidobacterium amazonense]|uniref:DUF5695 domain-containing protein n=1 Tax=Bifidobacterium amazonense TaxID=2809027 RepID=A0ABS9VWR3_9BIFI|nr:DUF5695 domain-containing protein [Bifidobacterium amazonense]MCH9276550.1 DUF5695 domain-containing protein [Bifidobacterium amazonense]
MGGGRIIWRIGGLDATFDAERAAWTSLRSSRDANGTEFLLTPDEFPGFDGPDARWLGNLAIDVHDAAAGERGASDAADGVAVAVNASAADAADRGSSDTACAVGRSVRTIHTAALDGLRTVEYPDASTIDVHIAAGTETAGLAIAERFRKRDDDIEWTIELENASDHSVTIDRLGVPLLMNQFFRGDDSFKYEQCVLRHMCLIGRHSWAYWQKSSGAMPLLLVALTGRTAAYSFTVDHDPRWQRGGGAGSTFEGVYELNLVDRPSDAFPRACGSLTLAAGERMRFTLAIAMHDSYDEAWDWLASIGGFMLESHPGTVVPVRQDAEVTIRSATRPTLVAESEEDYAGSVTEIASRGDDHADGVRRWHAIVRLGGHGRRVFHVKLDGDDRVDGCGDNVSRETFFGIEPPETIYRKQNAFVARNQWETDPTDPCYHGLLMWDMANRRRINATFNPDLPDWMAGGSDEIGLVSGLMLSEWNVYRPNEEQLHVLDGYCRDFIEQRLTEQPGCKVHRMVPWFKMFEPWAGRGADDVWRAFNYVHVANTFLNMYRIAKRYRAECPWLNEPAYWLERATRYFAAMFDYWMFPDGEGADHYANMGESVLAMHLADALRAEGLDEDAARIQGLVEKKAWYFAGKAYPYGSEMAYDSTAYEAVYGYGAAIGDERVMESSMRVALANRGRQPDWALGMTDLRGCGDSGWNVSYMTQLGAWTIYDWALERRHYDPDLLRSFAASYLAGFSIYNSGGYLSDDPANDGASAWIHVAETGELTGARPGPRDGSGTRRMIRGFVPYSGESALGYFGALRSAASFVMSGPADCGALRGYGCELLDADARIGGYTVRPADGLRVRFFDTVHDWAVKLDRDALAEVRCETVGATGRATTDDDRSSVRRVTLTIDNVTGDAHAGTFSLRMPAAGTYRLTINGDEQSASAVQLDADWHRIVVPLSGVPTNIIRISR